MFTCLLQAGLEEPCRLLHGGPLSQDTRNQRHHSCCEANFAFRISNFERRSYFLAVPALEAASAYFLVKRSTRPAVSTSFCLPVK